MLYGASRHVLLVNKLRFWDASTLITESRHVRGGQRTQGKLCDNPATVARATSNARRRCEPVEKLTRECPAEIHVAASSGRARKRSLCDPLLPPRPHAREVSYAGCSCTVMWAGCAYETSCTSRTLPHENVVVCSHGLASRS